MSNLTTTAPFDKSKALIMALGILVMPLTAWQLTKFNTTATTTTCKEAWDANFVDKSAPIANLSTLSKNCYDQHMFDSNLATYKTPYQIDKNLITVNDTTYPLTIMGIKRTTDKPWYFPIHLEAIELTLAAKTIVLQFGTKELADEAYKELIAIMKQ